MGEQLNGVGGTGGVGQGPNFGGALVQIEDTSEIPELDTATFCKEYHVSDVIRELLDEQGFDPINSLFEIDEVQLNELGFKLGHLAELRWALKKMLLDKWPTIPSANAKGGYTPSIYGGRGGRGGDALQLGGTGGAGKAAQIGTEDVFYFGAIGGGFGGAGGAGGPRTGIAGNADPAISAPTEGTIPHNGRSLTGGVGGAGGWGHHLGGLGGLGGAPQISPEYVSLFGAISGGVGGAGGAAVIVGGVGGVGDGPKLRTLLVPIDDETRRRVQHTKLEAIVKVPAFCQLLKGQGFETVGGLFEAYVSDLPTPPFKLGYVAGLKASLKRFATDTMAGA